MDDAVDTAERQPLHDLRRKVAEERAKADKDREERARRLHRQRSLRRWEDADGMGNLLLRLPADQMREVDARLRPAVQRRKGRAAVGDALGGATEGWTPEQIVERHGGRVTGIVAPYYADWRTARPIAPARIWPSSAPRSRRR